MKNNNDQQIRAGRATRLHRAIASTDIVVNPRVIEQNLARLASRPKRKRRINYAKKIINDSFLKNV